MTYGGDFSAEISGLVPDNRYYFRAADSDDYRPYEVSPTGWWCSFDTRPVVETLDATEISSLSATLNGNLPSLLPSSSSEVYFQWGTESGSYPNETPRQTMTSAGTFSAGITGLTPGATY